MEILHVAAGVRCVVHAHMQRSARWPCWCLPRHSRVRATHQCWKVTIPNKTMRTAPLQRHSTPNEACCSRPAVAVAHVGASLVRTSAAGQEHNSKISQLQRHAATPRQQHDFIAAHLQRPQRPPQPSRARSASQCASAPPAPHLPTFGPARLARKGSAPCR